jgi:hypothetical protein
MARKTSFTELYSTIGAIVTSSTGRTWWKKDSVSAQRSGPRAVVYISELMGNSRQMIELIDLYPIPSTGDRFTVTPWGTGYLDVEVEFYGKGTNDSATDAATRFRQSLYMEQRHFDLWEIAALTGGVRITDISAIFREDNEQRTRVRFTLGAHVADPEPLADTEIPDIETQRIDVIVVHPDETETEIEVNIENTENDDSGEPSDESTDESTDESS